MSEGLSTNNPTRTLYKIFCDSFRGITVEFNPDRLHYLDSDEDQPPVCLSDAHEEQLDEGFDYGFTKLDEIEESQGGLTLLDADQVDVLAMRAICKTGNLRIKDFTSTDGRDFND